MKRKIDKPKYEKSPADEVELSSGNVFADLGVPNPEVHTMKVELVILINGIIKERGLRQSEAAKILDIDQSKISALSRGVVKGFSFERLFRFLSALDMDTQIVTQPAPKSRHGILSSRAIKKTKKVAEAV